MSLGREPVHKTLVIWLEVPRWPQTGDPRQETSTNVIPNDDIKCKHFRLLGKKRHVVISISARRWKRCFWCCFVLYDACCFQGYMANSRRQWLLAIPFPDQTALKFVLVALFAVVTRQAVPGLCLLHGHGFEQGH